jgi:hypothetical protein
MTATDPNPSGVVSIAANLNQARRSADQALVANIFG